MAGIFLVIQILSGFFLTMFYVPHIDYAFDSIEHIMRDVNFGWLVRYIHSNGASFFFFIIYIHILNIRRSWIGSSIPACRLPFTLGLIRWRIQDRPSLDRDNESRRAG